MKYINVSWFCLLNCQLSLAQPMPAREFRGVWIATVANVDFPSQKGLKSKVQKKEFVNILNKQKENGINAVFFQVRPAADAFYKKSREPWSRWLTGEQGKAPKPNYDPLLFMIEQSHRRSMEFHAWFNPYRATFDSVSKIASNHITQTKPEWFLTYNGKKLFNPGLPQVRDYLTQVILDVVKNYDIDGVHFDDYFYPYSVANDSLRDEKTFRQFNNDFSDRNDWRRNNVNLLIKSLKDSIFAYKPYLKFGVSPFGVWRNSSQDTLGSDTQAGQTAYDNLYADVRLWLQNGWIDYVIPQVYFSTAHPKVNYTKLTDWWTKNCFDRHLYIGLGAYKTSRDKDSTWHTGAELGRQIAFNRTYNQIQGAVFFSSKTLINNPSHIADSLRENYFASPALLPIMAWKPKINISPPQKIKVKTSKKGIKLSWKNKNADAKNFVVYRTALDSGKKILIKIVASKKRNKLYDQQILPATTYSYTLTGLDRLQNEGTSSPPLLVTSKTSF
ncbi:MAG: family 10 glycosylhydrolase [Verrucomicrobia bacterium]|nr:family 10 glycosylhydrolase [Cytophagales bacterium]